MKSKKIPDDIRAKSVKEAQNDIKDLINELENTESSLEKSMDKYNRMLLLNYHIQEQFKKKANEIKISKLNKKK